jgi:hypothetical protein
VAVLVRFVNVTVENCITDVTCSRTIRQQNEPVDRLSSIFTRIRQNNVQLQLEVDFQQRQRFAKLVQDFETLHRLACQFFGHFATVGLQNVAGSGTRTGRK